MDLRIVRPLTGFGQGIGSGEEARNAIGDLWIVLDVAVAVEETGQPVQLTVHQNVFNEGTDQGLVGVGLIVILWDQRAVGLGAAARIGTCAWLQVIPMFDDFAVFESKTSNPTEV